MEGVGSRLGRASSRYSPATVFNGPVRRWKKKWVHVSSSSSSTVSYHNSQSNGHNSNTGSRLLLCKWTPLTSGDAERSFGKPEEPPRRKFRYTPVSVLEEQKKEAARKAEGGVQASNNQSTTRPTSKIDGFDGKFNINNILMEESEASDGNVLSPQDSKGGLDLGLCLIGHNDSNDSKDENKEGVLEKMDKGGLREKMG
ncbi:hypothetical protein AAG906_011964 [Vitis piasezkii]